MDSDMRKTGSSDDLQDREEGDIRLQRAVDPRFEDAKAANTESETVEMAIDILDLLGDRLGSELGLPAMPGEDEDDEPTALPTASTVSEGEGAISFSDLSDDHEDDVEDGAEEIAEEVAEEVAEDIALEDILTTDAEPVAPSEASQRPGVRSLADLLANAQTESDDLADFAETADVPVAAEEGIEDLLADDDDAPQEQLPAEAEADRWDTMFADDADDADTEDTEADAHMDGDAWPDEMEADPESDLDLDTEWDATPVAAPVMDESAEEDLSLDDLPPEVSDIIGPGPDAPEFEIEDTEPEGDLEIEPEAEAKADAFGEEWPFRTDNTELENDGPADLNFEGTDEMTENSMTPEETQEAAAPARKGFFGRFKKAAPEAQAEEAIAPPVEAETTAYVEPDYEEATQQDEEAPAPAAAPRKSRKGLLLASTAVAACIIGAGAFVLGPQLSQGVPAQPIVQRPAAVALVQSPDITVAVVEEADDLLKDDGLLETPADSGLYDPAGEPTMPGDAMPDDLVLSVDEADVAVIATPGAQAPAILLDPVQQAPKILLDTAKEEGLEPKIEMPALSVEPAAQAPVKAEPADIEFAAGRDDPGNGGLDDLFIRDEAPTFTSPSAAVAPVVDLSKYVPLTEFEALQEQSRLLEADIEELREAIELRDEAMLERDDMLQGAISAAARAENLAMSQNEVLVQVYELGAKMETAESLVVDLSKRLAEVEMIDPADREAVEERMSELDRRVEGVARDVGLVARMAINGGGKIPSTRAAAAPAVPVMAEPVFDTGVSTVIAPNADPSKIPGDVKIGQTVPGYGEVLDIIPTSDGGRLVVMEHGSAVLD